MITIGSLPVTAVCLLLIIPGCSPHVATGPHLKNVAPGDLAMAKKYVTLAEQAIRDALKGDPAVAKKSGELKEIIIESVSVFPHGIEGWGSAGPSQPSVSIDGLLNCEHATVIVAIAIGRERPTITEPDVVFIKGIRNQVEAVRVRIIDPELKFAKP